MAINTGKSFEDECAKQMRREEAQKKLTEGDAEWPNADVQPTKATMLEKYIRGEMSVKKPSTTQIGGNHYKDLAIQPAEYCEKNQLTYLEGAVVKYVTRHKAKGKAEDLRKAIHCLELLIEYNYP